MKGLLPVFRRELKAYFATPVAYVFIVIFLLLTGIFTFFLGGFYERNQADLEPFFRFHPWLYLLLIPAISMRLWSEERRSGTLELLMTLPISPAAAVTGKFLAAWCFTAIALALTFPMWLTVNYLGEPDNAVILAGYVGSLIMAGGFLAIGACISAITRNQVIAFVVSVVVCFCFVVSGSEIVINALKVVGVVPQAVLETVASFSFLTHFDAIMKGVIDLRDVVYFGTLIALWLFANVVVITSRKVS